MASWFGFLPYRCHDCGYRFLRFRRTERQSSESEDNATAREIRSTRAAMTWKRRRIELGLYGAGVLLFLLFLYYLTQTHGG